MFELCASLRDPTGQFGPLSPKPFLAKRTQSWLYAVPVIPAIASPVKIDASKTVLAGSPNMPAQTRAEEAGTANHRQRKPSIDLRPSGTPAWK